MSVERRLHHAARELRELPIDTPRLGVAPRRAPVAALATTLAIVTVTLGALVAVGGRADRSEVAAPPTPTTAPATTPATIASTPPSADAAVTSALVDTPAAEQVAVTTPRQEIVLIASLASAAHAGGRVAGAPLRAAFGAI